MRICSHCGELYPEGANVCGIDGTRLEPVTESVATNPSDENTGPSAGPWPAMDPDDEDRSTMPRFAVLPQYTPAAATTTAAARQAAWTPMPSHPKRSVTAPGSPARLRAGSPVLKRPDSIVKRPDTAPAAPGALRAETPRPQVPVDPPPKPSSPREAATVVTARDASKVLPPRDPPPKGPAAQAASPADAREGDPPARRGNSGPPAADRVLGNRYRLERRIAVGGFGEVFSAEDLRLAKRVAVKVLAPMVAGDPDQITRFRREAVAASMIGHEGIVSVTDFDRHTDGTYFIVMELLDGQDLARIIETTGAMAPERALAIAVQIASALECAHGCGVLHRDLKPANVFLTTRGNRRDVVKIIDFGISKMLGDRFGNGVTLSGQVVGTPYYMAPEQAEARPDLDARVDVYALGVILYEMLVGAPLFNDVDALAASLHRGNVVPPPPSSRRANLWPSLDLLVLRALSRSRDARYPSMATFGAALLRELQAIDPLGAALHGARPAGQSERPTPVVEPFGGATLDAIPDALVQAARGGDTRPGTAPVDPVAPTPTSTGTAVASGKHPTVQGTGLRRMSRASPRQFEVHTVAMPQSMLTTAGALEDIYDGIEISPTTGEAQAAPAQVDLVKPPGRARTNRHTTRPPVRAETDRSAMRAETDRSAMRADTDKSAVEDKTPRPVIEEMEAFEAFAPFEPSADIESSRPPTEHDGFDPPAPIAPPLVAIPPLPLQAQRLEPQRLQRPQRRRRRWWRFLFFSLACLFLGATATVLRGDSAPRSPQEQPQTADPGPNAPITARGGEG